MDNYKFGNMICELREKKGFTQKELAEILDVSDKAVSKWENGQAIPRMNVLEQLASTLETSVEELISLSRENVKRIYIKNEYATIAYFKTKDGVLSLKSGESKWVELDINVNEYTIEVYGDINFNDFSDDDKPTEHDTLKDSFMNKIAEKGLNKLAKFIDDYVIKTKCTYVLTNISDESRVTFVFGSFSVGDKLWIDYDTVLSYPDARCEGCKAAIKRVSCINSIQLLKTFKRFALTSELGISIPFMLIAYPFRKMYFKRMLKPNSLLKFLNKADYYIERDNKRSEKAKKSKHPIIKLIFTTILFIVAFLCIRIGFDVINVNVDKPILVSADLSQIEFENKTYKRIDDLPDDAKKEKILGIEHWIDTRTEGLSKLDQYLEDNKAQEYTDSEGSKYLWLVIDYTDNMLTDDGHAEYDDFETHYVYKEVK